jgi:hypothetical protein
VARFASDDVALLRRSGWLLAAGLAPLAAGAVLLLVAALSSALDTRMVAAM